MQHGQSNGQGGRKCSQQVSSRAAPFLHPGHAKHAERPLSGARLLLLVGPTKRKDPHACSRLASNQLHCSQSNERGNGSVPDQVLRALLQVNHVVPEEGGALSTELGCPVGLFPKGKTDVTHFCSSASGSTSMFSCRSFTLKNTYESRSGLGTARKNNTAVRKCTGRVSALDGEPRCGRGLGG